MGNKKRARFTYYETPGPTRQESRKHQHVSYSTTTDGRLKVSTSFVTTEAPPNLQSTAEEVPDLEEDDDDDYEALDPAYLEHLVEMSAEDGFGHQKRRLTAADEPMKMWLEDCDMFLGEMMGHEGRVQASTNCPSCSEGLAHFECRDCHGRELLCQRCLVETHVHNPLHRIKSWNGLYFVKVTLRELGLRIQLGHPLGDTCPNPERCSGDDFTILDTQSIQSLLRSQFYPATVANPRTAATFHALETFELLSYVSKVSAFEYYQALSRLSDNTGLNVPNDWYQAFLRMIRQWCYLKLLKRAGQGHDSAGARATKPGECAVLCPACPQPDKNLLPGWQDGPEDKQWLYALFLGIDANFRLKRKKVSSDKVDPDLNQGCAYFVEEREYKEYLANYKEETEPKSSCSRHDAVNLSESNPNREHASTGVGTIECAWHDMKRPNAVGDLQKGERYCNMDYLFYKSLWACTLLMLIVSYDIACQWSVSLKRRMANLDPTCQIFDGWKHVIYLVPKFHLPAHVAACRTRFSFNFTKGVGRTDGEAPERGWAEVNPLAASTKEMGPGSRRDTLDAHFGDYNWRKVVGMGGSLFRKMKAAGSDMYDHVVSHSDYESSLPPASVAHWTAEVEAWEKDASQPNPYALMIITPTQASIRRELAKAEAQDLAAGRDFVLDENVSPSTLISLGIDLEMAQRALKVEAGKIWLHAQDRQKTSFQLHSNTLSRKIDAWRIKQQLYTPCVAVLRNSEPQDSASPRPVHQIPLWLPSQIGCKMTFDRRLADIEWRLRVAQAYESLDQLRNNLQIRSYLFRFKDRFVRGQTANTRARSTIATVQARIDANVETYRAAHTALLSLGLLLGKVGWQGKLQPLGDSDVQEISEAEDSESEGRRKLSWIWKTLGVVGMEENDELCDALRVEWCKSRARAMRFTEEVELLQEEMMRVLRFLEWQEAWWRIKGQCEGWGTMDSLRIEALRGYAERQAALRRELRVNFSNMWRNLPEFVQLMRDSITSTNSIAVSI